MTTDIDAAVAHRNLIQRRVLAVTSISYIVVLLDTSIVNVALERIAGTRSTDISGLQWVVNAYTFDGNEGLPAG